MDIGDCNSEFLISRNIFPVHLNLLYGASPETTSRSSPKMIKETIRNTNKFCLVFEDNLCQLTQFLLILYIQKRHTDCDSTILCATKTSQAMNRLNEKNLGAAPDNPSMRDINDINASTQEKNNK